MQISLTESLRSLRDADVRRLAWAIGSPSLFDPANTAWQGRLRSDEWAASELNRCADWLRAQDNAPEFLTRSLGDPLTNTPLGHTFEKLVLFWQATRPDVRASTRGLMVRNGGRTLGEFDIVLLRHDGVIETLEVTVKYYLNLRPELGIDGCIGPRAFDRMSDKFGKMTTRQTDLGHTEFGRAAISRWLEDSCGETLSPDQLIVENYALARGYVRVSYRVALRTGKLCYGETSQAANGWALTAATRPLATGPTIRRCRVCMRASKNGVMSGRKPNDDSWCEPTLVC